jgi:Uma2 family endonuclease
MKAMLQFDLKRLPSTEELPCSDDTPVDNENQNLLPNILLFLLKGIWAERRDWFFGVDMALYHETGENPDDPVVPDGFLSLGVERIKAKNEGKLRRSYAVWEEGVAPILALEIVSRKRRGEYAEKLEIYRKLGILYYVIYNPEVRPLSKHQSFEVYKLIGGDYQLQTGDPYWMPEVGLGIGRCQMQELGIAQEQLAWFDAKGDRYLTSQEQAELERQRADAERQAKEQANQRAEAASQRAEAEYQAKQQERQAKERLEAFLRSQGIDPTNLPDL